MGFGSTRVLYAVNLQSLEKLWFGYFKAFIKPANTEPRGATVYEAKPFSTGWGMGKTDKA